MADNKQIEDFREELNKINQEINDVGLSIELRIKQKLTLAVAEAQKLGEAFSKNKDITKSVSGEYTKLNTQLSNNNKEIELSLLKEKHIREEILAAVKDSNDALADGLADKLQNVVAGRKLYEQLDAQLRSLEKQNEERKKQNSLSEGFKQVGEKILGDQIKSVKTLTTLTGLMVFLVEAALKADKQTTELAKSLIITKKEARDVRYEFVEYSRSINDTFITTTKLIEANAKLGQQLGLAKVFSMALNKEFVNITQKVGVSEEAAGGLFKNIIASGKGARQVLAATVGTIEKIKQENGLRLNNKNILEATGKVAGQLLANFKASPQAIAEAIAKTQVLGTTLEQTAAQGKTLLEFESSIDNELKAELLTGRELNLERARAAALMGDQKTVAEELAKQALDFNEFSKLNVIQQETLAKALGLSADALSDQLFKQQYLNKSREEILAIGGKEALQRMEALSAQDKFNAAVEKLQDLLGNIVAGPLGSLIDGFASLVSNAWLLYPAMLAIGGYFTGKMLVSTFQMVKGLKEMYTVLKATAVVSKAKAVFDVVSANALSFGLAAAGIAAGIILVASATKSVEDAFIPSSGPIIKTKAGTFQGRPDDNVMVGTKISPLKEDKTKNVPTPKTKETKVPPLKETKTKILPPKEDKTKVVPTKETKTKIVPIKEDKTKVVPIKETKVPPLKETKTKILPPKEDKTKNIPTPETKKTKTPSLNKDKTKTAPTPKIKETKTPSLNKDKTKTAPTPKIKETKTPPLTKDKTKNIPTPKIKEIKTPSLNKDKTNFTPISKIKEIKILPLNEGKTKSTPTSETKETKILSSNENKTYFIPIIAALDQMTNTIKDMTYQRSNINIDMDGRKVGTGTYGASTKFR